MRDFTYQNATELVFGRSAIASTGEVAARHTDSRVAMLVHSGRSSWEQPHYEAAKASLEEVGFRVVELAGIVPNPRLSKVREGVELARAEDVGLVVGLGGGSAIDTAKGIAAGVLYEGDVWDLYTGVEVERALPVGAITTIAATGADAAVTSESAIILSMWPLKGKSAAMSKAGYATSRTNAAKGALGESSTLPRAAPAR